MSRSSQSDSQASRAFASAVQAIYEDLVTSFDDAVTTLQRLQAESAASSSSEARVASAPAPQHKAAPAGLSQIHLYTTLELAQQVEQMLQRNGVPSQAALADVMRELDQLHAAVDRRLAALRVSTGE